MGSDVSGDRTCKVRGKERGTQGCDVAKGMEPLEGDKVGENLDNGGS